MEWRKRACAVIFCFERVLWSSWLYGWMTCLCRKLLHLSKINGMPHYKYARLGLGYDPICIPFPRSRYAASNAFVHDKISHGTFVDGFAFDLERCNSILLFGITDFIVTVWDFRNAQIETACSKYYANANHHIIYYHCIMYSVNTIH